MAMMYKYTSGLLGILLMCVICVGCEDKEKPASITISKALAWPRVTIDANNKTEYNKNKKIEEHVYDVYYSPHEATVTGHKYQGIVAKGGALKIEVLVRYIGSEQDEVHLLINTSKDAIINIQSDVPEECVKYECDAGSHSIIFSLDGFETKVMELQK